MAGYMVAGGESGIHSLVPVMSSNNQNGISLSVSGNQDPSDQAYYVFDGNFPLDPSTANAADHPHLSCIASATLSVYVTFSSPKKVFSVVQCPIKGSNFGFGTIALYAKDENGDFIEIAPWRTSPGESILIPDEDVQAYTEYRIDGKRGGSSGIGIAQLQLYGK